MTPHCGEPHPRSDRYCLLTPGHNGDHEANTAKWDREFQFRATKFSAKVNRWVPTTNYSYLTRGSAHRAVARMVAEDASRLADLERYAAEGRNEDWWPQRIEELKHTRYRVEASKPPEWWAITEPVGVT